MHLMDHPYFNTLNTCFYINYIKLNIIIYFIIILTEK